MFVWGYIAVTVLIAWRWRSKAALVAIPALAATMALFGITVAHAGAYSSAVWAVAGLYLLINSEYVSGTLYGISGLVYVALYLGALNATLSAVHIVSDLAFISGLVAGTWSDAAADVRGAYRRLFRRSAVQIARQDLAGGSVPDREIGRAHV